MGRHSDITSKTAHATPCATIRADVEAIASRPELQKKRLQFAETLNAICRDNDVIGMSLAVFRQGEIVEMQSYGYADLENKIPATSGTKYRAASVSKPVTFMGAMMLCEQGRLKLDAPISELIGIDLDNSANSLNTTRHLMTHTSTIGDTDAYFTAYNACPRPSLNELKRYGNIFTADTAGTRYQYSNLGAGLVAAVIESVTRQRFYDYMNENLFDRLEIDAAYLRTQIKDNSNIANIYENGKLSRTPGTWDRTEKVYDPIPLGQQYLLGQSEMMISAPDLAKIGMLLAGDGSIDGVRFLSLKSIEAMSKPYISDSNMGYGLGLRMNGNIINGRMITGHPGQAFGMVSGLYFDRSDQTGIAMLTNGCRVEMPDNGVYRINNDVIRAVYEAFFTGV